VTKKTEYANVLNPRLSKHTNIRFSFDEETTQHFMNAHYRIYMQTSDENECYRKEANLNKNNKTLRNYSERIIPINEARARCQNKTPKRNPKPPIEDI
jgi:hypothetical protein